jgi:hypothetical protein
MEIQKVQNSISYEAVASELFKLNLIVSYPYTDELLEAMAKTIIRLMPDVEIKMISDLMDAYLFGCRTYDKEHGISKIITALNSIKSSNKHKGNNF